MYRVLCVEEFRNLYKILVGKPDGKRSCGIPRFRWKDYIEMLKKGKVD
jgi:hypothetical protein